MPPERLNFIGRSPPLDELPRADNPFFKVRSDHVRANLPLWFYHISRWDHAVFPNQRQADVRLRNTATYARVLADMGTLVDDRPLDHRAAINHSIGQDDRFAHDGAWPYDDTGGKDTAFYACVCS